MKDRIILHVDLNNFYASVEAVHNPHYRVVPMAVCGEIELRHGIVLAKNELAKKMGVKTGDTIHEARAKCPNIEFCSANFSLYLRFSKLARAIYERFTDKVESFGIDECWLDVTASTRLFGSGEQIADKIRSTLIEELGLSASVGVSFNKIFAKLGSDYKKPNATTIISRENYKEIVFPLPAKALLFVGKATDAKLKHIGITTIGDIAQTPVNVLTNLLGVWGEHLHKFANGNDTSEVRCADAYSVIKSVGNSTTTKRDMINRRDVEYMINMLSDSVASRLREYGFKANTVSLYIRDSSLITSSKQLTLPYPTNSATDLSLNALKVFEMFNLSHFALRSIGVQASSLVKIEDCNLQLDMFNSVEDTLKREKLEKQIDNIRKKFGYDSVKKAIMYTDESLTELNNPKEENVIHPFGFRK